MRITTIEHQCIRCEQPLCQKCGQCHVSNCGEYVANTHTIPWRRVIVTGLIVLGVFLFLRFFFNWGEAFGRRIAYKEFTGIMAREAKAYSELLDSAKNTMTSETSIGTGEGG